MSSASCPPARRLFAKEQQPFLSIPEPFSSAAIAIEAASPAQPVVWPASRRAAAGGRRPSACALLSLSSAFRADLAAFPGQLMKASMQHRVVLKALLPCPYVPGLCPFAPSSG